MKKYRSVLVGGILGVILLAAGVLLFIFWQPQNSWQALPFICVGTGCGLAGGSMGELLRLRRIKKRPEEGAWLEIEKRDERNIALNNRAKGKAFDLMLYVFAAMLVMLALFNAPLWITLCMAAAYLFILGSYIFYLSRYQKDM